MAHGIGGGGTDEFVRQRFQGVRIGEADVRGDAAAHQGDLAAPDAVVDDRELGHVGAGAAGRRAEHQRRQGAVNPVGALIIADGAAIGDENGDSLGGIHGAAAAQADDYIRPLPDIFARPLFHLKVLRVGGDLVEIDKAQAGSHQALHRPIHPAGREQPVIADEENLFPAQPFGASADLVKEATAENDFRHLKLAVMIGQPASNRLFCCQVFSQSKISSPLVGGSHCFFVKILNSNSCALKSNIVLLVLPWAGNCRYGTFLPAV